LLLSIYHAKQLPCQQTEQAYRYKCTEIVVAFVPETRGRSVYFDEHTRCDSVGRYLL